MPPAIKKRVPVTKASHFHTRRRLVAGILALPVIPFSLGLNARSFERKPLPVIGRWHTGNHTLFPFTREKSTLYINGNATLEAWDSLTGQQWWSSSISASANYRPRCNARYIVSCGRNQISCFLRVNGEPAWSHKPRRELGVPLVAGSHLYIGEGNLLLAIEMASGEITWEFPILKNARIAYAPIEWGGIIYLGSGDGILYAIQANSGELLWKIDREKDWQYLRQLHIENDVLVAGGYHDELFGIDLDNGDFRWRFNAGNFINSHLVSNGMTYFWSPTGWIYTLEVMTGKVVWRHRTKDFRQPSRNSNWAPLMAEMVTDGSNLYALAMDNIIHILDAETGEKRDEFLIPETVKPFICLGSEVGKLLFGSISGDILLTKTI